MCQAKSLAGQVCCAVKIEITLRRFGLKPAWLTHIGRGAEKDYLAAACAKLGIITDHNCSAYHLMTDGYMKIVGTNAVFAAPSFRARFASSTKSG